MVHVQNRPECLKECPDTHTYYVHGVCYTVCPAGYPHHTADGQCHNGCPPEEDRYRFDDEYTCLERCPDDYSVGRGGSKACYPVFGTLGHKYYTANDGDNTVSVCGGKFSFHVKF